MKSTQLKLAFFLLSFIAIQLCSNTPPVVEGRIRKWLWKALKPTCAGCAGICERKAPRGCRCIVDQACLKRLRG